VLKHIFPRLTFSFKNFFFYLNTLRLN
jgi:hypothetical protein